MEQKAFRDLCKGYLADSLDPVELKRLLDYLRDHPDADEFMKALQEAISEGKYPVMADKGAPDIVFQRVLSIVRKGSALEKRPDSSEIHASSAEMHPTSLEIPDAAPGRKIFSLFRLATAAALISLIAGIYFFKPRQPDIRLVNKQAIPVKHDVAPPAGSKAIITLANGDQIALDSATNGNLATQGNVRLLKKADGQIAYAVAGSGTSSLEYNTLHVPRGSRFVHLTLTDGTGIWLNAGSSLHYPTAFTGQERRVEITGEAYFEVTRDDSKPFVVRKVNNNTEIQVLGTHFNINAYDDEENMKVTLLEGGVKVVKEGGGSAKLDPGCQAQLNGKGQIKIIRNVDTMAAVAWKNNLFSFHDVGIQEVMRQLSRWYDIEVSFQGKQATLQFNGEIGRNLSLRDVLEGLAFTNVHYRIEGNKQVIILP